MLTADELKKGQDKLDTCSFRSLSQEKRIFKPCCSQKQSIEGYHCLAHDLFPIKAEYCFFCTKFKEKITTEQTNSL